MTCEAARANLALYLYHELSFEEEETLEQHLDGCAHCRTELERERGLQRAMDATYQEPSDELLAACRREFERRVAAEMVRPPLWMRVRQWLASNIPLRAALRPVGALALVAVGFFGARLWDATKAGDEPTWTRVRSFAPDPRGGLKLVVEEVREKNLTGRLDDEHVRQMLIAATADPADPGLRAQTLDILKDRGDSADVRRALLRALATDTNAGVRLKALEGLKRFGGDAETRRVLSGVLLTDDNPGVRTQAIDLLLEQPRMDAIGTLQELMVRESNPYIRHRTVKALNEMRASIEPF